MLDAADLYTTAPDGVDDGAWAAACGAVRDYCGWHVWPQVTETIKARGVGSLLVLPTQRLIAVDSVTSNGVPVSINEADWSEEGIIEGYLWSSRRRGVTVTITHGYPSCPDAILGVLRSLALAGDGSAVTQVTSGPHSATWGVTSKSGSSALTEQHKTALAPYRLGVRP